MTATERKRVLGVPIKAPAKRAKAEPAAKRSRAADRLSTARDVENTIGCPSCGAPACAPCKPLPNARGGMSALVAGTVHQKRWRAYERALNAAADLDPSAALAWGCPKCGASKGKACAGEGGAAAFPHEARRVLAATAPAPKARTKRTKWPKITPAYLRAAERAAPCPVCDATAGAPCVSTDLRAVARGGSHVERIDHLLANPCPDCGAEPGKFCTVEWSEGGEVPLYQATKGRTIEHPRRPASSSPRVEASSSSTSDAKAARAARRAELAALPERSVKCPTCGAEQGAPCKRPSGHATFGGEVHAPRRKAAAEAAERPSRAAADDASDPARRVECPTCHAAPGAPCTKRKRPLERPHEARVFAELGLDQRCPDCGAAAYVHCIDEDGTPLVHKSKGKLVTHAGRRTLALPEVDGERAAEKEPDPNACYECGHTECPIHPDCSGCSACAAAFAAAVRDAGPVMVELSALRRDGGTQPRAAMDMSVVEDYAEAILAGAVFPPGEAFFDGTTYWLADGFHRAAGFERAGRTTMLVHVRQGTRRDAVLFSVGANADHGLRRSNADKRRAVETLLRDEEWQRKADRWIAERCGVSHPFVGRIRAEVVTVTTSREGQDGKTYPASQPSRPTSNAPRTTVELDGDPGPPEEPVHAATGGECRICHGLGEPDGCPVCERVECSLCYGQVAPGEHCPACDRRGPATADADLHDDASHGAGGPVAHQASATAPVAEVLRDASGPADERIEAPSARRRPRDVLELPAGAIDPQLVIEHHVRLSSVIGLRDEERVELDRARALLLSQWDTMPDLADRLVELAGVRAMDRPSILEPSAGNGALVDAIRRACGTEAHVTAHEVDPVRVQRLRAMKRGADLVHEGDFLAAPVPSRPYDAAIANTPYEAGMDGRFLERMMEACERVVALCRLNVLTGADRCTRVWSRVKSGEWHMAELVLLEQRPEFIGPGDDAARSDYCIVKLRRAGAVGALAGRREPTMVTWR